MNKIWLGAAVCGMAAIFAFSGCGNQPSVHVLKAEMSREPFVYETKAPAEAVHSAPVIPAVSGGILTELPDVGTVVKAGDVLFKVDSSQYESQASALQQQLAASAAQNTVSSGSYGIDNSLEASLLKQGIITRAEYERIKGRQGAAAPFRSSSAPDPALAASLQAVEKLIASCTVRAPIDGVISQVYAGDKKLAVAGKPALVIRQDTPVSVTVEIPARMDETLEEAKTEKSLTVSLSDGTEVWYGELKPQPNTEGDKYRAYKIQVDNPDNMIVIGNDYSVRIDSGKAVDCFLIPKSALIGEDRVAVINDNNLADIRTVDVAGERGGYAVVLDGIQEGDRVVVDPPKGLDVGMQVEVR